MWGRAGGNSGALDLFGSEQHPDKLRGICRALSFFLVSGIRRQTCALMKLARFFHLSLACAALAFPPDSFSQAGGGLGDPSPPNLPALRIRNGQLSAAVDELSATLDKSKLPAINVIFTPEARLVPVPELTLRNVNGADALRLIAASAGCELEAILGTDGQTIGYRIFTVAVPTDPFGAPLAVAPAVIPGAPTPTPSPLVATPDAKPTPPQPMIVGFGGGGGLSPSGVRVYSLGGITGNTKFDDVEATLKDVLRADGVSADAAKLAFHQRTNVLVVNGDYRVQELVGQFLEALQKNAAAAAAEDARGSSARQELIEAKVRMQAELEVRAELSKRLEETESQLRVTQRELDRLSNRTPKPQ